MNFIHYDMSNFFKTFRTIHQSLQKDPCCHKSYLGIGACSSFHSYLVPNKVANWISLFHSYPLGDWNSSETTRLSTDDIYFFVLIFPIFKNKFRDLSSLTTSSISWNDSYQIFVDTLQNFCFVLNDWKLKNKIKKLILTFFAFSILCFYARI